jgi:hypothetical protein
VSPFTELALAGGATWTDGTRTASSVEGLQRLFLAHGATEVFARIGTRRTLPGGDGVDASLARGVERARLAQRLGVPLNPELSLFGTYGDLSCQTAPDFSEYPEIVLPGPWASLGIDDRAAALRRWARLAATALLATGVTIEIWDLGNEVDFGVAGVAVRPLPGSACDAAEGTATWYGPPDSIDPAIGTMSVQGLLGLPVADRIAWLQLHLWPAEARLLAAAAAGVRLADPSARFSTHLSGVSAVTADQAVAFFEAMAQGGYRPDQLGLSYYPSSSATPALRNSALADTVGRLQARFGVPVFIAELGYPALAMTAGPFATWNQALPSYPLTDQGQYQLVRDLSRWGASGRLSGIRPWAPELVAPAWLPMSYFGALSGCTVPCARPALDAIADGVATPDAGALRD